MDGIVIEPVSLSDIAAVYPEALHSLFWEHGLQRVEFKRSIPQFDTGLAVAGEKVAESDLDAINRESEDLNTALEKEAWINTVFLSWGECGYSLRRKAHGKVRTVATLFFAPPRFCPTTFSMPSGPISPDAIALTSLHYNPIEVDREMQRRLIETALSQLAHRGVRAVEAFGCSGVGEESTGDDEPMLPETLNLDNQLLLDEESAMMADLQQQLEDSVNPQPCQSSALGAINHGVGDVIKTKILMSAGFTVATPHPVHPKLRIELDAELDWNEAVGEALDRHAAEQILQAENYSSFSASRS